MWQILVFFLGALAIAASSFRHFANPESHEFFRTLALLALWAVFVISLPWWSRDVPTARQAASWLILAAGLILGASALFFLHAKRNHGTVISGSVPPGQPHHLVTGGPYRYIRHPIYGSMILLAWGLVLKSGSWIAVFSALLATGLLYLTARTEEDANLDRFGMEYEKYMAATRMFVPGLL